MLETSAKDVDLGAFPDRTTVEARSREIGRLLETQPLFAGKALQLIRVSHSTHSVLLEYRNPTNDSDLPLLVKHVMISSGPQQAAQTVCREFTALQTARTLAGNRFDQSIPDPLLVLPEAALMVTKKFGGIPLSRVLRREANWIVAPFRADRLREVARSVGRWLGQFHQVTQQPDILLDADEFEREIGQQLERCKRKRLSVAAADDVFRIASHCVRQIADVPLPAACRHGDFTPRNILLEGEEIRILDFENFAKSDTVYEDTGKYIAYLTLLQGRPGYSRNALTLVRRSFLEGYGDSLENHIVDLFALKAATRMIGHRGIRRIWSLSPLDSLYLGRFMELCAATEAGFHRVAGARASR